MEKSSLQTSRRVIACTIAAAASIAALQPATAATATGNGTVTANIQAACNLVAVPTVAFGTLSSVAALAADAPATGTITVACSNGAPYTVYIGDGANRVAAGSGLRQMANGTARLPYQLYKEVGYVNIWDATGGPTTTGGAGGVGGTGNGANQNLTVYGRIASGTTLPTTTGAYLDTVAVTVAY